jgi:MarR family transcriptional regulator, organic hydroperoxide resistance regulator
MGKNKNQDGLKSRLGSMLCFTVYSTAHAFTRAYKPLLDALGLTYPQYLAMFALWENDNLSVKELGELLHLDSGTLTPLLKRLEAMGLVRRARDPADERSVRISLTPAGIEMRCKERTVHEGLIGACGHSTEELTALTAQLSRVRDNLIATAEGRTAPADETADT